MSENPPVLSRRSRVLIRAWLCMLACVVASGALAARIWWFVIFAVTFAPPLAVLTVAAPLSCLLDHARARRFSVWSERCPSCGYDLAGLSTRVCPECGKDAGVFRAAGGPLIIVVEDERPPAQASGSEALAEWRVLRTGLRFLVWCSTASAAVCWLMTMKDLANPLVFFAQFVLAGIAWAGWLIVRHSPREGGGENSRQQPPSALPGVGALIVGWIVWFLLTLAGLDAVISG